MGVYPPVFGPAMWNYLHTMTVAYPHEPTPEDKQNALDFLKAMSKTLPCPGCSHHCQRYFADHPPKVDNKMQFIEYMIDFHNHVNQRLGKRVLTTKEAMEAMDGYLNRTRWVHLNQHQKDRQADAEELNRWARRCKYTLIGLGVYVAMSAIVILLLVKRFRKKTKQHLDNDVVSGNA